MSDDTSDASSSRINAITEWGETLRAYADHLAGSTEMVDGMTMTAGAVTNDAWREQQRLTLVEIASVQRRLAILHAAYGRLARAIEGPVADHDKTQW